MQSRILRSVAVAAVLMLAVAGCGGSGANQGEPAGAVKAAFDAAQSGGIATFTDYACAAQKDSVADMFGGGDLAGLAALGIDADDALAAVKVEFKDIQTTEKSRSGDTAVVHVTGTTTTTIDPTKMRELLKQVMAAQGQTVDDATLDIMISGMGAQLTQSQALSEDVSVKQEGGKWLICD